MASIGIFPGTFDPVHAGHIAFAEAAVRQQGLDYVIFLPELRPRGKEQVTPWAHRYQMLELATTGRSSLRVLGLDSPQFTVAQTLPELRGHFPEDTLVLLLGSDVVQTFSYRWPGLGELLREMALVIGLRSGSDQSAIVQELQALEKQYDTPIRTSFLVSPLANAASGVIRNAPHEAGHPLLPPVAAYIKKHKLYVTSLP